MSITPARLYIAKETTAGTAVVPVAADVQHFDSCEFTPGGPGPLQRDAVLAQYDTLAPDCLPWESWEVELEKAVKHAVGGLDGALEIENQLLAGGFEAIVDPGVDRRYTLTDDPNAAPVSDTVFLEENSGDLYETSGLRWGMSFAGDNAGKLMATFSGVGRFKPAVSPFTPIGAGDSDYHQGENFCNVGGSGSFDWHGYGLEAHSFTLDINLTPETRDHMAAEDADYGLAWPADLGRGMPRVPVGGTLVFRGVKESVFALWEKYRTVAQGPGVITYVRGAASLSFSFPVTVLHQPQPAYEGATKTWTVPYTAHRDTANGVPAVTLISIGVA